MPDRKIRPQCIVHKIRPQCIVHKIRPQCIVHKIRPQCIAHKIRPQCIAHKIRPQCIVHKIRPQCNVHKIRWNSVVFLFPPRIGPQTTRKNVGRFPAGWYKIWWKDTNCRVIKKSLRTWWLQYRKLQIMFRVFLVSLLGSIWLLESRPPGPGGH
jgi:hypothetical protein